MHYLSTRGDAPVFDFNGAMMSGLAADGGLYLPVEWPRFAESGIAALNGLSYAETAVAVMQPFIGHAIDRREMERLAADAYGGFRHRALAPLVQIGDNDFVLELFHGPTLAFKDFAMQMLSRLMERELRRKGGRLTIIGATSGDTGAAAVEAFRGRAGIDLFILYPDGRVSDVQRRQMTTTPPGGNVHTLAIEGTFDDCQAIVKALFNDAAFRTRHCLSGVNSINWARIVAQIPYYFYAAVSLGAPHRPVSFVVPTGNFGDIFAGYAAKRMGLPVERLVIATNANDILARTLENGVYEPRGVVATSSPSMDIQVSSNFERLVFEATGRNPSRLRSLMDELKKRGNFRLEQAELDAIRRDFSAFSADENEVARTMAATLESDAYLADPHTAVGLAAARKAFGGRRAAPVVTLGTAHPAKFPQAVRRATGAEAKLPPNLAGIMNAAEHFERLPNSVSAVADCIDRRTATAKSRLTA